MTDSGEFDVRPVRAFLPGPGARDQGSGASRWPASVPAMGQLLREGLELPAGLTVLVGENGSGKSTVMETLAEAYGLNPQGGSVLGQTFRIRDSEATHSPVLAAIPGASLLELGSWGIQPATWDDLSLVVAWRQFMRDPRSFFRHLW
ncbi:MAG TPA: hypothetical protein VFW50_24655 [Streptosporangiaceae bacterium]|nr:hypothetical protein [Streptosporangiaceae bacterium]